MGESFPYPGMVKEALSIDANGQFTRLFLRDTVRTRDGHELGNAVHGVPGL